MKEQVEQYRKLLENIALARQINEKLAEKLIEEFCDRLSNQLHLLDEIRQDREISRAIHNKLEIVNDVISKRAFKFYACLPDSLSFKKFLIERHQETNFAFTHNQVSRACRNAVRQIETLVDYTIISANLLEWLFDNPKSWVSYETRKRKFPVFKDEQTRTERIKLIKEFFSLYNKLWLVNNYFLNFFKNHPHCKYSLMSSFDKDIYYVCYNLRNADSHGWNFNSSSASQGDELELTAANFESSLHELTKIIIPLRDLVKSIKPEDLYVSVANNIT